MTNHNESEPDREYLMFAAEEVQLILDRQPDLSGWAIQQLLRERAEKAPSRDPSTRWHLYTDEAQPFSFCGELPGPDRKTWHNGAEPEHFRDRFLAGDHCCPLCLLALGKILEQSKAHAED